MKTPKLLLLLFLSIASVKGARAQHLYAYDRVYTANQVSNTVSVIDPSQNILLGEIKLGKPSSDVLSPLYRGQVLVHGLGYSKEKKLLAVVSIGSNAITFISTQTNQVIKTIYVGRSPHEPTFTPDQKQLWISVRGEAYISVIDVDKMVEVKRIPVADGPGMVAFSPDGEQAYVCSSFSPELDIIKTSSFQIIKKIRVTSPFSPNIFTSPQGEYVALTHKDVGKVTVINPATLEIVKVLDTGPITNHVTFSQHHDTLHMLVTIGGENQIKIYDASQSFALLDSIQVGALPHGLWPSPDGRRLYVGLEYSDQVQAIDLKKRKVMATIAIGQSPQALVYAPDAVAGAVGSRGLSRLNDPAAAQVLVLTSPLKTQSAQGRLSVRSIGLTDLIEQAFSGLQPNWTYTLSFVKSPAQPQAPGYVVNSFVTDGNGKYTGQSTGLVKTFNKTGLSQSYGQIVLIDTKTQQIVLQDTTLHAYD